MCILCQLVIRNETAWCVHLNSKIHKESITTAKRTKLEAEGAVKVSTVPVFKRPLSPTENKTVVNKKIRGILKNSNQPAMQDESSLPTGFFDSKPQSINSEDISMPNLRNKDSVPSIADVESMEVREEEKAKDINPAVLPEGFFDDPVMDAKVRFL